MTAPGTAAVPPVRLEAATLKVGDSLALTVQGGGMVRAEGFRLDSVTLAGSARWPAAAGAPSALVFPGTAQAAHCQVAAAVQGGVAQFQVSLPPAELHATDGPVRVVLSDLSGHAVECLADNGATVLADLRIADAQAFARRVQSPVTRTKDLRALAFLADWALGRFPADSATYASAACILGYRIVDLFDELKPLAPKAFAAYERCFNSRDDRGFDSVRWRISGACACGYVSLMLRDFDAAARYFEGVANRPADLEVSRISAHNMSICAFLAGWLRYKKGDLPAALAYFRVTMDVIKVGIAAQPVEINYSVYNECARMALLAQQVLCVQAQLDPHGADRLLPAQLKLEWNHVFRRAMNVGRSLPADFKKWNKA